MSTYTVIVDSDDFGTEPYSMADIEAACERMAERLGTSYIVRTPHAGEAGGTYENLPGGTLRLLGHTSPSPVPDDVGDAIDDAWEHASRTWPDNDREDS